jgi:soluble lytic murein transglycosylase
MDSFGWPSHPRSLRGGAKRPPPVAAVPILATASGRPGDWRAISRRPPRGVKTPSPPSGNGRGRFRESFRHARTYTACAAAVAILAGAAPQRAAAQEPLCDWLFSLGAAAQAQSTRDLAGAGVHAARALRARPRGEAAARANAALGLALAREEPARAADALEVALRAPVPGRAHLAYVRGEALLDAGNAPQAARLFAEASRPGELALSRAAALREAQALLAAGLEAEAVPALEALLAATTDAVAAAPARLALARGLRALGQPERAASTLHALWLEVPDLPEARAAGEALAAWRVSGGPVPPDAAADHVARAERLLASGRPDETMLELDAASRADEPEAHAERATLLRGGALLALGRHGEAERTVSSILGAADPSVQRGARLVRARAAARAGRVEEASRLYAEVGAGRAAVPGLPEWRQRDLADESSFLAAWLFYDAGQYERAIGVLERFARGNPRSRRAEDALWFAAWSRYRLGRTDDADRAFARLARGPLADAALYWRARLARNSAAKRALYRASHAMGGDGWYAVLSRIRLTALGERPGRAPAARAGPMPDVAEPWAAARLSIAVELLGLGLRDAALAELRELARNGRIRGAAPLVAQLAAFADDFEIPFRMARDHLSPTRRSLRWLYPEPLPQLLVPSARQFGVEPALLLAVMRRESSFRADARSGAGAEGLLQLRPETAERLAALLGVPGGLGARLREPEASIPVGAHYLGLLLGRFGEPALAIAAYNAGPLPVAQWARDRATMPLDAWIESIPYRETRQYVKGVFAGWDAYRALSGAPPPPIDADRPVAAPPAGVAF